MEEFSSFTHLFDFRFLIGDRGFQNFDFGLRIEDQGFTMGERETLF
jgi:hypothetical protein